jgi:glycosyltransferase involved in cell wall biosynthesis
MPVHVAALLQRAEPHPWVERVRSEGVAVTEIRCGRRQYGAEIRAVEALIRDLRPAVVQSHNYHADIVALFAARRGRVPVVSMVHGFSDGDFKNRIYEALDRILLRFFDHVICVSDTIRQRAERWGCPPSRISVIQNGYAAPLFKSRGEARALLGIAPDEPAVGWLGRLSPMKGPDLLVEAVAQLSVRAAVVVIGDGPESEALQRRRDELGIAPDRLRLLGARAEAAQLMRAFDAIVLSSRSEGTPMVVLEAMAAGVPVVSFAVGGIPAILDASSGWLVPPADTAALAAALREVLTDRAEAARRVEKARIVLDQRFGVEPWLEKIHEAYRRAIARS